MLGEHPRSKHGSSPFGLRGLRPRFAPPPLPRGAKALRPGCAGSSVLSERASFLFREEEGREGYHLPGRTHWLRRTDLRAGIPGSAPPASGHAVEAPHTREKASRMPDSRDPYVTQILERLRCPCELSGVDGLSGFKSLRDRAHADCVTSSQPHRKRMPEWGISPIRMLANRRATACVSKN